MAQRIEQVPTLDFDFTSNPPLSPPFTATYEGAVFTPQYGAYTFQLEAEDGDAVLYLDEEETLKASDETARSSARYPAAFTPYVWSTPLAISPVCCG